MRGMSVGVNEAAKNSVPSTNPSGENDNHRRNMTFRIIDGSLTSQCVVEDTPILQCRSLFCVKRMKGRLS